jgi:diguanylate cyclase (GGDEF)-like protein
MNAYDNNHSILASQPALRVGLFCVLILIVLGIVDHVTGYEIAFLLFYLAPVGLAAWRLSRPTAIFVSVLAASISLLVDYTSGHTYSHPAIAYWNAAVRLSVFVIIAHLISVIRSLLETQTSLAQRDGLTGLINARSFGQACTSVFDHSRRYGHTTALGYIDIDGFKGVNDSLGHSVGDEVLKAVGWALANRLRVSDMGARLGGDEFAILLPETAMPGTRSFFTELHTDLVNLATYNEWPIGFSIGVAVFVSPPENPDEAIRHADELMYKMKDSGTNSIQFAEFGAGA